MDIKKKRVHFYAMIHFYPWKVDLMQKCVSVIANDKILSIKIQKVTLKNKNIIFNFFNIVLL